MDERDPDVVAALRERAERGRPRGATAVLEAAERETGRSYGSALPWVAAAAVLLIVVGAVVAATRSSDPQPADRVDTGPPATDEPGTVGSWTVLPSFTNARAISAYPSSVATGDLVTFIGLSMRTGAPSFELRDSATLDVVQRSWRTVPDPPFTMAFSMTTIQPAVSDGRRVLVLAPAPATASSQPAGKSIPWALDPSTGVWQALPDPFPQQPMMTFTADGSVLDGDRTRLARLDATGTSWRTIPLGEGLVFSATVVGNDVVVIGAPDAPTRVISPDGVRRELAPAPFVSGNTHAWANGDQLVLFDGNDGRLAVLDVAGGTWTEHPTMPGGTTDSTPLGYVGRRLVVASGLAPTGVPAAPGGTAPTSRPDTMYAWDPAADRWDVVAPLPSDFPQYGGVAAMDDRLLLWFTPREQASELQAALLSF